MAQKDYVGKKKKHTSKKNNSRIIPNLMMAFAVILVVLFAGTLYFVSNNHKSDTVTQTKKTTEKPTITLPEKPEERFKYLKELEKNATNSNNSPVAQQTITPSEQEKERQQILNGFMNDRPSANITAETTNTQTTTNQTTQEQPINVSKNKEQWLLQCGAFKDKANAESLKAKLAMFGMPSSLKSGSLHRIFVGPFNSKLEADNAIKTLKSNGISGCINATK